MAFWRGWTRVGVWLSEKRLALNRDALSRLSTDYLLSFKPLCTVEQRHKYDPFGP